MNVNQSEQLLGLIEKISPHAKKYVQDAIKSVTVEHFVYTDQDKSVFLFVDDGDCCIFYAASIEGPFDEVTLGQIQEKTLKHMKLTCAEEICFNVYGENIGMTMLVRKMGFKSDMEGFHMGYQRDCPNLKDDRLTTKNFDDSMILDIVDLFDSAYEALNRDNHHEINGYRRQIEEFKQKINRIKVKDQVQFFYSMDQLVGAYVIEQDYITDLVVNPIHQNKGYGTYLLSHCIEKMRSKGIDMIKLRVAKSNRAAKRLYERFGFIQIASYAEHTYKD